MKTWTELVHVIINLAGGTPVFERVIPLYIGASTEPDLPMGAIEWVFDADPSAIIEQLTDAIKIVEVTDLKWIGVLTVWECSLDLEDHSIDVEYKGIVDLQFNGERLVEDAGINNATI